MSDNPHTEKIGDIINDVNKIGDKQAGCTLTMRAQPVLYSASKSLFLSLMVRYYFQGFTSCFKSADSSVVQQPAIVIPFSEQSPSFGLRDQVSKRLFIHGGVPLLVKSYIIRANPLI